MGHPELGDRCWGWTESPLHKKVQVLEEITVAIQKVALFPLCSFMALVWQVFPAFSAMLNYV